MTSSPLAALRTCGAPEAFLSTVGGAGRWVTPLASSACRLGRASATTASESAAGALRLNRGAPESELPLLLLPLLLLPLDGRGAAMVAESPGLISAFGLPSSELETARRILGGPSVLPDELLDELFDELLEELLEELSVLLPELDDGRRSLGRSGSLSPSLDERLDDADELVELSSELDAARRSVGWFPLPLDELPEDLLAELLEADELSPDRGSGFVSSVCSDASECSSAVPSVTIDIDSAL